MLFMEKPVERNEFWRTKSLVEMTDEEYEVLCDGCGKCCFLRYEENLMVHYTRICCDYLDIKTGLCTCYEKRFAVQPKCCVLAKDDVLYISRMPKTCAYRLVQEKKPIYNWHPLIQGNRNNVPHIKDAVHEREVAKRETEFDISLDDYEIGNDSSVVHN